MNNIYESDSSAEWYFLYASKHGSTGDSLEGGAPLYNRNGHGTLLKGAGPIVEWSENSI